MYLYKFSVLFFSFLFVSSTAMARQFTDMECIKGNFKSEVSHKGQPFGLTQNILKIQKEQCVLRISHEKMKVMKNYWVVDVCREPVHIKKGAGAVEIMKREGACSEGNKNSFCESVRNITKVIQDDGLIFAPGEKEDLASAHGRVYCTYLLMNSYLQKGIVFSRHKQYQNILDPQQATARSNKPTYPVQAPVEDKVETKSSSGSKDLFDF